MQFLTDMDDVAYLYIPALGGPDALYDMYLMDDTDNPIYETGFYEDREPGLYGLDASKPIEPSISGGDWGWLCSAWYPVCDDNGEIVCHVGCDVSMDNVMSERARFLTYMALYALGFTVVILIGAILFANRVVIKPLNSITNEMKRFVPQNNGSYKDANVVDLNIRSRDEVRDIYEGIRTMQMSIIDYLSDLSAIRT